MRRCLALIVLTATSCGGGVVQVPAPTPSGAAATACATLERKLPQRLAGQDRVTTRPASPYVAAWGEPAIALRCGVDRPAGLNPTDQVTEVNGVAWFEQSATLFTTVAREAYVEVTVPGAYQAAEVLIELAGPIKAAVP